MKTVWINKITVIRFERALFISALMERTVSETDAVLIGREYDFEEVKYHRSPSRIVMDLFLRFVNEYWKFYVE